MLDLTIVALASLLAGFIDAVAGGGGLVLTPALFSTFPQAVPATLMGSNKAAAIWGTAWATRQYVKRVSLPWRRLMPAAVLAGLGSFTGAWVLTLANPDGLRKALPLILLAVFVYTLAKKELGRDHTPRYTGRKEAAVAGGIALVVGFYDGFFGPGTGSFFVFLFVRVLGYDFLHASATAKLMNLLTNAFAIALFASKGYIWWHVAAVMAVTNVAGSLAGTRLALKHGAGFVRGVFVLVVGALILKTAWDAFVR
ncbi:MAG: sulfite exporter TauE/SafE family protein [Rubrivivax sp.]|nr:MAG: sulfite exporter TauE/SafE family protein [Rubrivivax sp.]